MGQKSRSGEHEQDFGPLPSRWMRFIKEERQKRGVAEDRPHGHQSSADLEEAWAALVAGTELEHHRWHCLRRGGATQLWASGAQNQIIMLAGGWESPLVARHYTKPKHAWKFVERGEQPVPVCRENGYRLMCGDWSSKQWCAAEKSSASCGRGTGGRQSSGTNRTSRPKKEKDRICRTARGRVEDSGRMASAWERSWSWERSWKWT